MAKTRVFISFDYENDEFLRTALVGQSRNPDSPFELADFSNKEHLTGDWKEKTRSKIKGCDLLIAVCGEHAASGINAEIKLAQEENVPYVLLAGYADKNCVRPSTAKATDKMYNWTWQNLKNLVAGGR